MGQFPGRALYDRVTRWRQRFELLNAKLLAYLVQLELEFSDLGVGKAVFWTLGSKGRADVITNYLAILCVMLMPAASFCQSDVPTQSGDRRIVTAADLSDPKAPTFG